MTYKVWQNGDSSAYEVINDKGAVVCECGTKEEAEAIADKL